MKNTFILLAIFSIATSCKSQKTESGWSNLLNKGTSAWHTYGKSTTGSAWSVENGVLQLDPSIVDKTQRGDLASNEEYRNFHLKYEWKISKNGNSGVMFNVMENANKYSQPYFTGPEMQVLDNDGHPDGKIYKHRAGDLYDLIASSSEPVKPVGEWNIAEIISNNGKLEFFLNGVKIISTVMWDSNWDKLVAGSKFKDMPDFGKFKSGRIVLQDHGNKVWYKNIRIKKL